MMERGGSLRRRSVVFGLVGALAALGATSIAATQSVAAQSGAAQSHSHAAAAHQATRHKVRNPHEIKARRFRSDVSKYRSYVASLIKQLNSQVTYLQAAVAVDDFSEAQSIWLTMHLTWLRIGQDDGAYGAFGALGRHIDGTAAGLSGGTSSSSFTGFHKVEFDLWTTHNLLDADNDVSNLSQSLQTLSNRNLDKTFPVTPAGVSNFIIRAHETIEDGVRDSLSGDDDYGSGTDAASVTADAAASAEILRLLAPALKPRAPHLVHHALKQLEALVSAADETRANGKWVSLQAMSRYQRERLDATAGAAAETLALVPDLLPIHFPPNTAPVDDD